MGNPWINGEFVFDVAENNIFTKDEANYINGVGIQELDTVGDLYILDIYLDKDNYVDLHYHANASELTYCVKGTAEICFINPTTEEWACFELTPGKVISIPQGFWHEAKALEDGTHIIATHDTDNLQTTFGSDLLRLTPKEVMANIHCLDEAALEEVLSPIDETIAIGPPVGCERMGGNEDERVEEDEGASLNGNDNRSDPEEDEGATLNENENKSDPAEEEAMNSANEMNPVNEEPENRMSDMDEQQPRGSMHSIPRVEGSLYTCPICKQTRHPR